MVVQKPRSDVYTTMLFLSFLAILVACLCLYLEMRAYNMDFKAQEATVPATSSIWPEQSPVQRIDVAACRVDRSRGVSLWHATVRKPEVYATHG